MSKGHFRALWQDARLSLSSRLSRFQIVTARPMQFRIAAVKSVLRRRKDHSTARGGHDDGAVVLGASVGAAGATILREIGMFLKNGTAPSAMHPRADSAGDPNG